MNDTKNTSPHPRELEAPAHIVPVGRRRWAEILKNDESSSVIYVHAPWRAAYGIPVGLTLTLLAIAIYVFAALSAPEIYEAAIANIKPEITMEGIVVAMMPLLAIALTIVYFVLVIKWIVEAMNIGTTTLTLDRADRGPAATRIRALLAALDRGYDRETHEALCSEATAFKTEQDRLARAAAKRAAADAARLREEREEAEAERRRRDNWI